jgi:hypothetical protein
MSPTAVIAGNYREFTDWCAEQQLSPRSPGLLYVDSASRLRGRRDLHVERVGTWQQRDDLADIEGTLRLISRRAAGTDSPPDILPDKIRP